MTSSKPMGAVSRGLLAALVLVLAVGAIVVAKRWMQPPTQPPLDIGQKAVEEFLDKIRAGHAGEAWDAATAEFKSIEGRESFIKSAGKSPTLKQELRMASSQAVKVKDEPRTEYVYQSPDSKMVRVLVGYEGGIWKVDRLTQ